MGISKHKQPSAIASILNNKRQSVAELPKYLKISFQYLDTTQKYGSGFTDWQNIGLLSSALATLQGYCCSPVPLTSDDKFTIYGACPSANDTLFNLPANTPEDANWARIHVNGPAVIVGHIVTDTFYVVFLDKTHSFFLTKLRKQRLGRK